MMTNLQREEICQLLDSFSTIVGKLEVVSSMLNDGYIASAKEVIRVMSEENQDADYDSVGLVDTLEKEPLYDV